MSVGRDRTPCAASAFAALVLEGEGALHTDGEDAPVNAGSCIHLPAYLLHSLENSGESTMRIVAVFHPAGDPASRAYEANE